MKIYNIFKIKNHKNYESSLWVRLHLDAGLLIGLLVLMAVGLMILYSASNENIQVVEKQALRFFLAFIGLIILAQIPPDKYRTWAPWLFSITLVLLVAVLIIGHIGKGGQRWINLGLFRFQPSEIMKIALPMMLAWYFHNRNLPPTKLQLLIAAVLIIIPTLLIAKQPDLGTATLILAAGFSVILLAGISWRMLLVIFTFVLALLPILWHFMYNYQRERVLTFLNPERDPLGAGYHIIQSKIAIGSGGMFGKGWLNGTQSHLQFLPEHATDFIFAVCGEEFGLIGSVALIILYMLIALRAFYIASNAQDTFTRLLAGSLASVFLLSVAINIGMVTGILPVVGLPLPLISYGGTSVVALLAGFGIIMSINSHRKLVS